MKKVSIYLFWLYFCVSYLPNAYTQAPFVLLPEGIDSMPPFLISFMDYGGYECEVSYYTRSPIQKTYSISVLSTVNQHLARTSKFRGKKYFECQYSGGGLIYYQMGPVFLDQQKELTYIDDMKLNLYDERGDRRFYEIKPFTFYARWEGNCLYILQQEAIKSQADTLAKSEVLPAIQEEVLFNFSDTVGTTRILSNYGEMFMSAPICLVEKEVRHYTTEMKQQAIDTVFTYISLYEPQSEIIGAIYGLRASRKRGIIEIIQNEENLWSNRCRCLKKKI